MSRDDHINSSVKNGVKTFDRRLLTQLFSALADGNTQASLVKKHGLSKQLISYYVKQFVKNGLLLEESHPKSAVKIYRPTDLGQKTLARSQEFWEGLYHLANLSVAFDLVTKPVSPVDWSKVGEWKAMRNWGFVSGFSGEVYWRMTPHILELQPEEVYGSDPFKMWYESYTACLRCAGQLEGRLGVRLGLPRLNRKPHIALPPTEKVRRVAKLMSVSSESFDVDNTPRFGTLENKGDKNDPLGLFLMPDRVKDLEDRFTDFDSKLDVISKGMATLGQAVNVNTSSQKLVADELSKLIDLLKRQNGESKG